ncbi:uncharacterized [Tachysurus ichikawai]
MLPRLPFFTQISKTESTHRERKTGASVNERMDRKNRCRIAGTWAERGPEDGGRNGKKRRRRDQPGFYFSRRERFCSAELVSERKPSAYAGQPLLLMSTFLYFTLSLRVFSHFTPSVPRTDAISTVSLTGIKSLLKRN